MRSPSNGPARATTISGVVEASVLTSASGSRDRARKNDAVAPKLANPRAICVPNRAVDNRRLGFLLPAKRTTAAR
jgi:hypothetical protein